MTELVCICGSCRRCRHREYMRGWRERNAEKTRAWCRSYYARNKERWATYHDPEKDKAQKLVFTEVRAGRLIPQPCEECGDKAEAHHADYSKPLEVRWLCRRHHAGVHADGRRRTAA